MDILEIKRELEEINKNLVENRGHLWPWYKERTNKIFGRKNFCRRILEW